MSFLRRLYMHKTKSHFSNMYFYGMQQWIPLLRCNWRHHTVQGNDPTTCCRCKWIQHAITGHYKRGMIAFWHLVCGKLCLPSQYAEEFADLSASHAIWLSSDSRAKKSRDLLLRLMVERFTSLLPEIFFFFLSFFSFTFDIKVQITCLFVSQCFTSKQQCYLLGILLWKTSNRSFSILFTW